MDKQGAHVGVALPADVPQFAVITAAELARGHTEPCTELATIVKPFWLTNSRFKGTGGEQANTADLIQLMHDDVILMPAFEQLLALVDEAGSGLTPQSAASADLLLRRSGLSPATEISVAADCGPTPN